MKTLFISLLFSLQLATNHCSSLTPIRNIFQAGVNETELEEMLKICKSSGCDKIIPYHAAATMKKAEFAWSPLNKLKYFKKGKKMLEQFIAKNPGNIEARYIRWLTQKMAPKFLGYQKNLQEDYRFIQKNINNSGIESKYQKTILAHIKKVNHE